MTTKIYYKISFPNNTCYIGKAKNYKYRMAFHKCKVKKGTHVNKNVQAVYDEYGLDNWIYEWLFVGTGTKDYHQKREYELIQDTPNTINIFDGKHILLDEVGKAQYMKTWAEDRGEELVKYQSQYYLDNKEHKQKSTKEYREKNKDEILRKARAKRAGPEGDEVRRKEREAYQRKKNKE